MLIARTFYIFYACFYDIRNLLFSLSVYISSNYNDFPTLVIFPFCNFPHVPYEKFDKPSSTGIGFLLSTILLTKSQIAICFYQLVHFLSRLFQPFLSDPLPYIFFKTTIFYIKLCFSEKNKNLLFIQKISFEKKILNIRF